DAMTGTSARPTNRRSIAAASRIAGSARFVSRTTTRSQRGARAAALLRSSFRPGDRSITRDVAAPRPRRKPTATQPFHHATVPPAPTRATRATAVTHRTGLPAAGITPLMSSGPYLGRRVRWRRSVQASPPRGAGPYCVVIARALLPQGARPGAGERAEG